MIRAIYEAVGSMGFRAGNILEPSCGVGNFFGMLPEEMSASRLYGVELIPSAGGSQSSSTPRAEITVGGDQVRPGGVVAFVTTDTPWTPRTGLYESIGPAGRFAGRNSPAQQCLFRANAGTDVVSDIIFSAKADDLIDIEPNGYIWARTTLGFSINSYFVEHPEMILGRQTAESTQYGRQDFTVAPIEGWNFPTSSMMP